MAYLLAGSLALNLAAVPLGQGPPLRCCILLVHLHTNGWVVSASIPLQLMCNECGHMTYVPSRPEVHELISTEVWSDHMQSVPHLSEC